MRRKPWPVILLAIGHLLAPAFGLLQMAFLRGVSPWEIMIESYRFNDFWGLAQCYGLIPLAGLAIFMVKEWSIPLFVAIMARVAYNDYEIWQLPQTRGHGAVLLAVCAINFAVVLYFLIPSVRRPFFNRRLRWWETAPRFEVDIPAQVEAGGKIRDCKIRNLSENGALIQCSSAVVGDLQLRFGVLGRTFEVHGKIVHGRDSGVFLYGIRFAREPRSARQMRSLARALPLLGIRSRRNTLTYEETFVGWLKTLLRSGKGLVPSQEPNEAATLAAKSVARDIAPARPANEADKKAAEPSESKTSQRRAG